MSSRGSLTWSMLLWDAKMKTDFTLFMYRNKLFFFFAVSFAAMLFFIKAIDWWFRVSFTAFFMYFLHILRKFPLQNWSFWIFIVVAAAFAVQFYLLSKWFYDIQTPWVDNPTVGTAAFEEGVAAANRFNPNNITEPVKTGVKAPSVASKSAAAKNVLISYLSSILTNVLHFLRNLLVNRPIAEFLYHVNIVVMFYSFKSILKRIKNSYVPAGNGSIFSMHYYRNIFTAVYIAWTYNNMKVSEDIGNLTTPLGSHWGQNWHTVECQVDENNEVNIHIDAYHIAVLLWICLKYGASNIESESSALVSFHLKDVNVFDFTRLGSFGSLVVNALADSIKSSCNILVSCAGIFFRSAIVFWMVSQYMNLGDDSLLGQTILPLGFIIVSLYYIHGGTSKFVQQYMYEIAFFFFSVFAFCLYFELDFPFALRLEQGQGEIETKTYALVFSSQIMRYSENFFSNIFHRNCVDDYFALMLKYIGFIFVFEFMFLVNLRFGMVLMLLPINLSLLIQNKHFYKVFADNKCITHTFFSLVEMNDDEMTKTPENKFSPQLTNQQLTSQQPLAVASNAPLRTPLPGLPRSTNIIYIAQQKNFEFFEDCKKKAKEPSSSPWVAFFSNDSNWFNMGSTWHEVFATKIVGHHSLDDIITSQALLDFAKVAKYSKERKRELFDDLDSNRLRDTYSDNFLRSLNHFVERGCFQLQFISMFIYHELLPNCRQSVNSVKIVRNAAGITSRNTLQSVNTIFHDIRDTSHFGPNRIGVKYMPKELVDEIQSKDNSSDVSFASIFRKAAKGIILKWPFAQKYTIFLIKGFYGSLAEALVNPFPAQRAENIVLAIEGLSHFIISSQVESRTKFALDYLPLFLYNLISLEIAVIEYLCNFCYFVEDFLSDAHNLNLDIDIDCEALRAAAIRQRFQPDRHSWPIGLSYVRSAPNAPQSKPINSHFISIQRYDVQKVYRECQSLSQLAFDDNITQNVPIRAISVAVDEALNILLANFGDSVYKNLNIPDFYRLRLEKRRSLLNVA